MVGTAHQGLAEDLDAFALVVGVSSYQRIAALPAVEDAADMAAVLRDPALCAYPESHVEVLVEAAATRSAILGALDRLRGAARQTSSVFVYFSGHGGQVASGPFADCYLMPFDGTWRSPEDLARTAISGKELSERLQGSLATRVTWVLDCCRAGGLVELKAPESARGSTASVLEPVFLPGALTALARGRGRAVLAASVAEGAALVVPGNRNSVFTGHLLRGLRGAAVGAGGLVRVCDLFHYVQQKVLAEHPGQRPVFKADLEENYPLALHRGGHALPLQLPEASDGCAYDAFVSYSRDPADRRWVERELVPKLERLGLRTCLADRDFRLGASRIREMERAVQRSRYTLAVLSRAYLRSAFEDFQMLLAQHQAIEAREPRFVPLVREECDLPLGIRATERLDVSDGRFEEATIERLAQRLREPYRMNLSP